MCWWGTFPQTRAGQVGDSDSMDRQADYDYLNLPQTGILVVSPSSSQTFEQQPSSVASLDQRVWCGVTKHTGPLQAGFFLEA